MYYPFHKVLQDFTRNCGALVHEIALRHWAAKQCWNITRKTLKQKDFLLLNILPTIRYLISYSYVRNFFVIIFTFYYFNNNRISNCYIPKYASISFSVLSLTSGCKQMYRKAQRRLELVVSVPAE